MIRQWSQEVHQLAGHPGPHIGCGACLIERFDCHGRIRYETAGEATDLVRELHERRQLAPPARVVDCRWCGFFHVKPHLLRPVPKFRMVRYTHLGQSWLVWTVGNAG